MEFPELLALIDERSAAFRAVLAAAPDLGVQVPSCPEWTLFDLAQHIGQGRRAWAATVEAGPETAGKVPSTDPAPRDRAELLAWLADSTAQMIEALLAAGPDRGCWVWWGDSQSPATCGAVARHQLQEISVHTYDAQLAVGAPEPLPGEVALDGVEEFLFTCCTTTVAWPHEPLVVDYHTTEGHSWRQWLSADGSRVARLTPGDAKPGDGEHSASARGTASELVLLFYDRAPLESLVVDRDRHHFARLIAWDMSA